MRRARKLSWALAALLAVLAGAWHWASGNDGIDAEVATRDGVVVGTQASGVRRFLGIPYAAPPLGALRWLPPQPIPEPWTGKRPAKRQARACVQGARPTMAKGSQEDCLYLNVWAPARTGPFPVMVWIHGGGLMLGSANEGAYDGAELARAQDVVVVTLNYRLGWLGFLSLDGLGGKASTIRGNQGFLDQVAALRWVRDNVAAFGGDPDNVTVFGESGGGVSTCLLLASPLTQGLMHKAILESGVCGIQKVLDAGSAHQQALEFLRDIHCDEAADPVACARGLAPAEVVRRGIRPPNLLTADSRQFPFYPLATIDDRFLPEEPMQLLFAGTHKDIPILLGTTKDEGSLFTGKIDFPETPAAYRDQLEAMVPGSGDALAHLYPYQDYQPIGAAFSQMFSDSMEICPTRRVASLQATHAPVYLYHFTEPPSAPLLRLMALRLHSKAADLGTYHGAELPYVFGIDSVVGRVAGDGQRLARRQVMQYWGNFARSGSPNGTEAPLWPQYSSECPAYLDLSHRPQVGENLRRAACDFWDRHREFSFW